MLDPITATHDLMPDIFLTLVYTVSIVATTHSAANDSMSFYLNFSTCHMILPLCILGMNHITLRIILVVSLLITVAIVISCLPSLKSKQSEPKPRDGYEKLVAKK